MCLPAEHYHENIAHGRECQQTGFGERIWFEFSIFESADLILVILVVTVQDGQVQVGRSLGKMGISVVRLEDVYSNSLDL